MKLLFILAALLPAVSCTAAMAQTDGSYLEGTVQIGALVPITGDASRHGQDIRATLDLAEFEINRYLDERGAIWDLDIVMEDSATSPVIALEKLAAIKAHGVDLVVGTYSSAELRNVMGYATSNNMLLIAYASTAPSLGIPGDKIFRFIPDATNQAPANAYLFESMGITHVIPVWRGDAWGDDLVKATKERFEMLGGVFLEGIRYNPEAIEFSAEVALLSDMTEELATKVSRDNIGILLLTFSEGVSIAQSAHNYENLAGFEWVGSDTLLNVGGPKSDRISSEFFDSQLSVTVFAPPENQTYDRVSSHVLDTVGREPIIYSLTAYEAAWALGLSLHAADSTDPELVAAALPRVLNERTGIFGKIILNDAGDMDSSTYEIWRLIDNRWIHSGSYSESGSIAWADGAGIKSQREDAVVVKSEGAGDDSNGGGCLIATAAFGSELAPQVQLLREIRDGRVMSTASGAAFMSGFNQFYYLFSPAVADLERQSPELRWLVNIAITPALHILGIMHVAEPGSEVAVIVIGSTALLAIAAAYVMAPIITYWYIGRVCRSRGRPDAKACASWT